MRNEPGPALRCEENDCRCGVEVERARLRVFAEMLVIAPDRGAVGRVLPLSQHLRVCRQTTTSSDETSI